MCYVTFLSIDQGFFDCESDSEVIMEICDRVLALKPAGIDMGATENFKNNLSTLLERSEYSKSEFARLMGVDPSTVTLWLSGKNTPSVAEIERIGKHFGLEAYHLLSDDKPLPRKDITAQEALVIIQEHLQSATPVAKARKKRSKKD